MGRLWVARLKSKGIYRKHAAILTLVTDPKIPEGAAFRQGQSTLHLGPRV